MDTSITKRPVGQYPVYLAARISLSLGRALERFCEAHPSIDKSGVVRLALREYLDIRTKKQRRKS